MICHNWKNCCEHTICFIGVRVSRFVFVVGGSASRTTNAKLAINILIIAWLNSNPWPKGGFKDSNVPFFFYWQLSKSWLRRNQKVRDTQLISFRMIIADVRRMFVTEFPVAISYRSIITVLWLLSFREEKRAQSLPRGIPAGLFMPRNFFLQSRFSR